LIDRLIDLMELGWGATRGDGGSYTTTKYYYYYYYPTTTTTTTIPTPIITRLLGHSLFNSAP